MAKYAEYHRWGTNKSSRWDEVKNWAKWALQGSSYRIHLNIRVFNVPMNLVKIFKKTQL